MLRFHFAFSFAVLMEAMPPFCSHYTTKLRGEQENVEKL